MFTSSELKALVAQCRPATFPSNTKAERFYRAVAIYFTAVFARLPFTPNQITFMMLVTGSAGAALLILDDLRFEILAVVLLHLSFTLDITDGDIARMRTLKSVKGKLLDRFTHRFVAGCLFFALTFRTFQATGRVGHIFLGFCGMAFFQLANVIPLFVVRGKYQGNDFVPEGKGGAGGSTAPRTSGLREMIEGVRYFYTDPGFFLAITLAVVSRTTDFVSLFYGVSAPAFCAFRYYRIQRTLES